MSTQQQSKEKLRQLAELFVNSFNPAPVGDTRELIILSWMNGYMECELDWQRTVNATQNAMVNPVFDNTLKMVKP